MNISNLFVLETNRPIKLKYYIKAPLGWGKKTFTNGLGYKTIPIYGITLQTLLQNQRANPCDLVCSIWGCRAYQACSNDDLSLSFTY